MGAQMSDAGVEGIAHRARVNHFTRIRRLYEQLRGVPAARRAARVSAYRRKWTIWAMALVGGLACTSMAQAGYGAKGSIAAGVQACLNNGTLGDASGIAAGSTCVIKLASVGWSNAVPNIVSANGYVPAANGLQVKYILNTSNTSVSGATLDVPAGGVVVKCGGSTTKIGGAQTFTSETVYTGAGVPTDTSTGAGTELCQVNSRGRPTNPGDGAAVDVNGIYPSFSATVGGTATLTLTFKAVAVGNAIKLPTTSVLIFNGDTKFGQTGVYVGVGGTDGTDPNPVDPPIAGTPPNCTAIRGVDTTTYDFGTATPGTKIGPITTDTSLTHRIDLDCTAAAGGTRAATATLYMTTSNALSSDKTVLLDKSTDWLGLAFKFPSTMLSGITKTANQTGDDVIFDGAKKTPVINWAIPAYTPPGGAVGVPALVLTPYIKQLQATPGAQDGARRYTVTYSAAIQ